MKMKSMLIAAAAGVSVMLSSCIVDPIGGYGTVSYSTNGYSSTVAWTSASYDANGFPIYGYSYGRPVYGYTAAGAAIFTIGALTALCYVPNWGPAPWYHGHHHYPAHIHRAPKPPRYEPGHAPHRRPAGGMNAPIHKNPGSVFGGKPAAPRPGNHAKPAAPAGRPGNNMRPANNVRPSANVRPGNNVRPANNNRPSVNVRPANNNRPAVNVRPANNSRPSVNVRPANNSRPSVSNRPSMGSRPSAASRPSSGSRPSASSRPSGGSRPSVSSRPSGGGSRGGLGAARRR